MSAAGRTGTPVAQRPGMNEDSDPMRKLRLLLSVLVATLLLWAAVATTATEARP